MAKRGRPKGSTSEKMREKKRHALSLIAANPTLSMTVVAEHVGVSQPTVAKWFEENNLRRWYS